MGVSDDILPVQVRLSTDRIMAIEALLRASPTLRFLLLFVALFHFQQLMGCNRNYNKRETILDIAKLLRVTDMNRVHLLIAEVSAFFVLSHEKELLS